MRTLPIKYVFRKISIGWKTNVTFKGETIVTIVFYKLNNLFSIDLILFLPILFNVLTVREVTIIVTKTIEVYLLLLSLAIILFFIYKRWFISSSDLFI